MDTEQPKPEAGGSPEEPDTYTAQLIFRIPEGVASRYAHHLAIQPGENEVVLSFFEIFAPMLPGSSPDEKREIIGRGVRADCVARITVAKNRFPDFVRAMNEILPMVTSSLIRPEVNSDKGN